MGRGRIATPLTKAGLLQAVTIPVVFIGAVSYFFPNDRVRQDVMACLISGAGGTYLNGGLGVIEFPGNGLFS